MRTIRRNRRVLCFLLFWILDLLLLPWLQIRAVTGNLDLSAAESGAFRQQAVSPQAMERVMELAAQEGQETGDVLAVFLTAGRMELTERMKISAGEYHRIREILMQYRKEEFLRLKTACGAVWNDISRFPAALDSGGGFAAGYEDSWMSERTYQGQRGHEGCDIFCLEDGREAEVPAGVCPVVSVTDGYVEKIGWLTLGGYRIGIRSRSGGYFYYAHLDSYARDFQVGDKVSAGELLGLMGDSGYGDEGTTGKFPVHLHFGIYCTTEEGKEISVNPYAVLRVLEDAAKEYDFS